MEGRETKLELATRVSKLSLDMAECRQRTAAAGGHMK